MRRRDFVKTGLGLTASSTLMPGRMWADVPDHLWEGYDFGPSPTVANRLDQGPFGISQDEGWFTIFGTDPSREHIRNFGTGLVGYTWEENGPALGVLCGRETLEQSVENTASLPFVEVLYIRCDWRDVQSRGSRCKIRRSASDTSKSRDDGNFVESLLREKQRSFVALPQSKQLLVAILGLGSRKTHEPRRSDLFPDLRLATEAGRGGPR